MRTRRPSPAMVVALIALFVALGGTSYSAITLGRNSVGTKQIKKGGVKRPDLARNAVTSTKVKNASLLAKDFRAGELPQGPKGDPGTARAYALIGSDGSVTRAKNVTGVSRAAAGVYCFDLPFTPDNAIATGARPGPGSFNFKTVVTTGVAPNLGACVAPFTDAVAATTTPSAAGFMDEAFFIMFN